MRTRRDFLKTMAAGAAALTAPQSAGAARFDVLIAGGRVIDPSRRLDRVMDVGLAGGRIAAVRPGLAASDAADVIDAAGRIVVPGLIDIHLHARSADIPSTCLATGVTSFVDAGSAGADAIDDVARIAAAARGRMRILLNIARPGVLGDGELLDIDHADVDAARAAIARHRDVIVGIKARLSRTVAGDHDLEALRRAQAVARAFGLPVMVHIGDTVSPLPAILALLKPGDIVTHVYSPPPHGIWDDRGALLPEVLEARRRGVWFDIGNGRLGHITWDSAGRAMRQGFLPDTISSDLTDAGRTDRVFDFPTVLSKFLLLGMPLDQVIARATVNAARIFAAFKGLGTLGVGAPGDVAVFSLQEGTFEFVDNENAKRTGRQKLVETATLVAGRRVDRGQAGVR